MTIQLRNRAKRERRRRWSRLGGRAALLSLALSGCASERELIWPPSEGPAPVRSAVPVGGRALIGSPGEFPSASRVAIPVVKPTGSPDPAPVAGPGEKVDHQVARATSTDPNLPLLNDPPVVPPPDAVYPVDLSTAPAAR